MYSSISNLNKNISNESGEDNLDIDFIINSLINSSLKIDALETLDIDSNQIESKIINSNDIYANNLYINNNKINSIASSSHLGCIKLSTDFSIDSNGILTINEDSLSFASTSSAGLVRLSSDFSIDSNGIITISDSAVSFASTSSAGLVRLNNDFGIDSDGILSLNYSSVTIQPIPYKVYLVSISSNQEYNYDRTYTGKEIIYYSDQDITLQINLPLYETALNFKIVLGDGIQGLTITTNSSDTFNGYLRLMPTDNKPKVYPTTLGSTLTITSDQSISGSVIEINSSKNSANKWDIKGDIYINKEITGYSTPFS